MRAWRTLRFAVGALWRERATAALAALAVAAGAGGMATVGAMREAAQERIAYFSAPLEGDGITVLPRDPLARPGAPRPEVEPRSALTIADSIAIGGKSGGVLAGIAPVARGRATVNLGRRSLRATVIGTTAAYRETANLPLAHGRFIGEADVEKAFDPAVLGAAAARGLGGGAGLIGRRIQVNGVYFQVVGVLMEKGPDALGQERDEVVIVPAAAALGKVLKREGLSAISAVAGSRSETGPAAEHMARLLRQRHLMRNPYVGKDDFSVRVERGMLGAFRAAAAALSAVMSVLAGALLIVGGMGLTNVMLASVMRREREIAQRRAQGASRRALTLEFWAESFLAAVAGGIVGALLGAAAGAAIARALGAPPGSAAGLMLEALAASAAVGIVFGLAPARRAARLGAAGGRGDG